MKKYFIFIISIYLIFSPVFSQLSKDDFFNDVKKKYSELKSAEFDFTFQEQPQFKGNLKIKTGNKYILNLGKRVVYSNGKTIWNYMISEKKVVISELDPNISNELALENLFFKLLESFSPENISRTQSSNLGSTICLTLIPKKDAKISNIENIKNVKAYFEPKSLILKQIQINEHQNTQTYVITNLKLNSEIKDEAFSFSPPKDIEVIDLR